MRPRNTLLVLTTAAILIASVGLARVNQNPAQAMADAAEKLLAGLNDELRAKAAFPFESENRTDWHFIPRPREGAVLKAMTPEQKKLVQGLLRAGTSSMGYDKSLAIMALESVLREIENTERSRQIRDPELYYVSIFGTPSKTGTWGWRIEGHHLSINYTIEEGKVVAATPMFFGANPAKVPSGPQEGLRTLAAEEDRGRELYASLEGPQKARATISEEVPRDIQSGAQNVAPNRLEPAGLVASELDEAQLALLKSLINLYADRHPSDISKRMMQEIEQAGWDKVRFGWYGTAEVGKPHAYQIQGPTFLIEYNNTQNNANHIHSVWRSYTGEFGQRG